MIIKEAVVALVMVLLHDYERTYYSKATSCIETERERKMDF
jgi:hypothetical protein